MALEKSAAERGPEAEAQWYVVHAYSGHEDKVKKNLEKRIESFRLAIADHGAPNQVAYFPDGRRLAVGMSSHCVNVRTDPESGDFSLRIYDAFSGEWYESGGSGSLSTYGLPNRHH